MANFAVIIDPDPDRRVRYLDQLQRRIAPVDNLVVSRLNNAACGAVWAVGPSGAARNSVEGEQSGLIFGDAIEVDSAKRVGAGELARSWDPAQAATPDAYDGYYAAIACYRDSTLTAGVDRLGLFPMYYAATKQVVIVSSTPELIAAHPLFPARISTEGLVGILLTDGLVDNRPLLEGICRLRPGRALVWRAGEGAREVLQYALPDSDRQSTLSFGDQVDQLDHALERAVARHTPEAEQHGMLLSGGLDSRMLAGYLEQMGRPPRALTMGSAGDYEVICATRVARVLRLDHRIATTPPSDFARTAILHATWDQLSSGFSSVYLWGMIEHLRLLAPTFTNGYLADPFAGGIGMKLRARPDRVVAWDTLFSKINAQGVEPETLKRMLRVSGGADIVDSVVERIKALHENASPLEVERLWRFQVSNNMRLRIGSIPWRMSFGSWPVLPILDRRVLDTAATLPVETIAARRAQNEILRKRFPQLARIPMVVQNAEMGRPLIASFADRIRDRLPGSIKRFKLPRQRRANLPDRRYIWRMYDFNGAGWQAIRDRAEPNRHRLAEIFDSDQLAAYLPAPGVRFPSRSFTDTMGRKNLVGLMLWAERHLA